MPALTDPRDIIEAWRFLLQKWEAEAKVRRLIEAGKPSGPWGRPSALVHAGRETDQAILLLHTAICGDPPAAAPTPNEDAPHAAPDDLPG